MHRAWMLMASRDDPVHASARLEVEVEHHNTYNRRSGAAEKTMSTQYLFVFAQVHDDFRIPELLSVAELHGFEIGFPDGADRDTSRPFMILELESEEHARLLARRCILIRSVVPSSSACSPSADRYVA